MFSLTLPSEREIAMRRVFNVPRRRLFAAWTRPEQVRRWHGCGALTLTVDEIDLSVSGSYCHVLRGPDGISHALEGTYREIAAPERLVCTERCVTQDFESNEALVTVTFAERHGKTTLASLSVYRSREDRDAYLAADVEAGAEQTFERLAAHLAMMA